MENNKAFIPSVSTIRKNRVVKDTEAAMLYEVTVEELRNHVETRHERFPDDFIVRLSPKEQKAFSAMFAFTPEGLAMLAMVLDSPLARQGAVNMLRAFVMLDRMAFAGKGI